MNEVEAIGEVEPIGQLRSGVTLNVARVYWIRSVAAATLPIYHRGYRLEPGWIYKEFDEGPIDGIGFAKSRAEARRVLSQRGREEEKTFRRWSRSQRSDLKFWELV